MKLWVNRRISKVHHLESYSTASLASPMALRHGSSREKAGRHSKLWISSGYTQRLRQLCSRSHLEVHHAHAQSELLVKVNFTMAPVKRKESRCRRCLLHLITGRCSHALKKCNSQGTSQVNTSPRAWKTSTEETKMHVVKVVTINKDLYSSQTLGYMRI